VFSGFEESCSDPFSIRSLIERQSRSLPVGILLEKRCCHLADGLFGQIARAVIEQRYHRNPSKKTLGRLLTVKGAVLFLCDPKLMQQHSQFSCHGD
jgi:hypothetical protein